MERRNGSGSANARRTSLEAIRRAAIAAVEPSSAVRRVLVREGDRLHVGGNEHRLAANGRVRLIAAGKGAAHLLTCDLGHDYVSLNVDYRS